MTMSDSKVLSGTGQCALVFGDTAGIGFACAQGFAKAAPTASWSWGAAPGFSIKTQPANAFHPTDASLNSHPY